MGGGGQNSHQPPLPAPRPLCIGLHTTTSTSTLIAPIARACVRACVRACLCVGVVCPSQCSAAPLHDPQAQRPSAKDLMKDAWLQSMLHRRKEKRDKKGDTSVSTGKTLSTGSEASLDDDMMDGGGMGQFRHKKVPHSHSNPLQPKAHSPEVPDDDSLDVAKSRVHGLDRAESFTNATAPGTAGFSSPAPAKVCCRPLPPAISFPSIDPGTRSFTHCCAMCLVPPPTSGARVGGGGH